MNLVVDEVDGDDVVVRGFLILLIMDHDTVARGLLILLLMMLLQGEF